MNPLRFLSALMTIVATGGCTAAMPAQQFVDDGVAWTSPVPKNSLITNLLLVTILVLFAIVGAQEVAARL